MLTRRLFASCAICAATGLIATEVWAQSAPGPVKRTILQQTDGPAEGYVSILVRGEIAAGALVPRHTHPGVESAYLLSGGGLLSVKGLADRQMVPGDGWEVPAYTPHALRNGNQTTLIVSTYVVEKGKPLVSPAPE